MIKNIAWDTKEKKIAAIIFTVIFMGQLFFETMRVGFNEITEILFIALAGIAFSLFFIISIEGKWNRLLSAQGVISVLTIIVTLGMAESYKVGTSTREGYYGLFFVSVALLLVQSFYLVPVAAILGAVTSLMAQEPMIQSAAMFMLPACVALSCICYADKFKEFAVWKKLVFIFAQLVMLAFYGYTVYCRLYTVTFHNLKTEIWDSAAMFVAVIILLAFAVAAIIRKKSVIEIIGYVVLALTGVLPMFMEMKYVLISAMPMFMVLTFASREGSAADDVFNGVLKALDPKNKSKSKPKKK